MVLRDLQVVDGRSANGLMTKFDELAVPVVELCLRYLGRKVQAGDVAKVVLQLLPAGAHSLPATRPSDRLVYVDWPFDFPPAGDPPSTSAGDLRIL